MTETTQAESWTLLVDELMGAGELVIQPGQSIEADGVELPVVLWRMTPWVMDRVIHALVALDDVGATMRDYSGEGPSGNQDIITGLESALEHLVGDGRLIRLPDPSTGVIWHDVPRENAVQP